ncbi:uncharacterized protein LOC116261158 [Nymphaea colorata]|nr:uncharacterized protein LOC116261158 [Nymphaea colorata]
MGWSPTSATNAYFEALKLCKADHRTCENCEPHTCELLSALAAGMSAKLIVEVTSNVSLSTIALAAAARQTGGRLVCILPEPMTLNGRSTRMIRESGLKDMVEFKVGDPFELVPKYENIDFSLVDCGSDDNIGLFKLLDVNPRRSVVVADNLGRGRRGMGKYVMKGVMKGKVVRTVTHPIGREMEVTKIGRKDEFETCRERRGPGAPTWKLGGRKSKWVVRVDEESGEEHIFRVPNWQRNGGNKDWKEGYMY